MRTHLKVALHECTTLWWAIRQSLSQLVDLNSKSGNFFGAPIDRVDSLANEGDPAESVSWAGDVVKEAGGSDVTFLSSSCKSLVVFVCVYGEGEGGTGFGLRLPSGLDGELHHMRGSNLELLACIDSLVIQIGKVGAATVDPYVGDTSRDEREEALEVLCAVREFGRYIGN